MMRDECKFVPARAWESLILQGAQGECKSLLQTAAVMAAAGGLPADSERIRVPHSLVGASDCRPQIFSPVGTWELPKVVNDWPAQPAFGVDLGVDAWCWSKGLNNVCWL